MTEISDHTTSENQECLQSHTDLTQNPASVYYLHPADHASSKLVTTPFDGSGFGDWKRSMMIGLIAKNKLCFVDGSLSRPTDNPSHMKAWDRCNNMVLGWLIASLDRIIAKSVIYNKYASDIWSDLDERFGVSTSAQIYALHEDLSHASQEANMTISEYFTKVKSIWDEIDNLIPIPSCVCDGCCCGLTKKVLKIQQDQRLMSFLMKVDEQYGPVKTNILMLPELPTISTAYRMLVQEQKHKEIARINTSSTPSDSMAFVANKRQFFDKSHANSRFQKNVTMDSSSSHRFKTGYGPKRPSSYFCDHCKVPGHSIERCFKLHGFPLGFKSKKFAGCAQDDAPKSDFESLGLTPTQLDNLMAFLSKQKDTPADSVSMDLDLVPSSANLAGPYTEKSSW